METANTRTKSDARQGESSQGPATGCPIKSIVLFLQRVIKGVWRLTLTAQEQVKDDGDSYISTSTTCGNVDRCGRVSGLMASFILF